MHPQMTLALDTAPATSFDSFHVDQETSVVRDTVRAFSQGAIKDEQLARTGGVMFSADADVVARQLFVADLST